MLCMLTETPLEGEDKANDLKYPEKIFLTFTEQICVHSKENV